MHKSAMMLFGAALLIAAPGCPKQQEPKETGKDQTSEVQQPAPGPSEKPRPGPAAPVPAATQPVATRPAATQPVTTRPASTYDSKPPYTVELYVLDPKEEQPGWIRIMELADDKAIATASATFPEQNRIYINTDNVQRLRIHVRHLPLNLRRQTVLRIDEQPMALSTTKKREHVFLRRLSTGEWVMDQPPEE